MHEPGELPWLDRGHPALTFASAPKMPRYTCPFVEKFSIEIETYYLPDGGQQQNVFNLSGAERRQRILGEALVFASWLGFAARLPQSLGAGGMW